MKYILSCTCPFLNCHLRHDKETGSDLCPAVVSEIVLGDAPVNNWPIFSLSLVKILEAFAKVNLVQFFPGSYVENRPFLHSCKQRHQLEAWVDKIHWFVWNCPPERQPHFFMFAPWSGTPEGLLVSFVISYFVQPKCGFISAQLGQLSWLMRCFHLFRRAWVLVWVVRAWKTWSEWLLPWGE